MLLPPCIRPLDVTTTTSFADHSAATTLVDDNFAGYTPQRTCDYQRRLLSGDEDSDDTDSIELDTFWLTVEGGDRKPCGYDEGVETCNSSSPGDGLTIEDVAAFFERQQLLVLDEHIDSIMANLADADDDATSVSEGAATTATFDSHASLTSERRRATPVCQPPRPSCYQLQRQPTRGYAVDRSSPLTPLSVAVDYDERQRYQPTTQHAPVVSSSLSTALSVSVEGDFTAPLLLQPHPSPASGYQSSLRQTQERDLDLERVIDKVLEVESQGASRSSAASQSARSQSSTADSAMLPSSTTASSAVAVGGTQWHGIGGGNRAGGNGFVGEGASSTLIDYRSGGVYHHFGGTPEVTPPSTTSTDMSLFVTPADWPAYRGGAASGGGVYGAANLMMPPMRGPGVDLGVQQQQRAPSLAAHPDAMRAFSSPEQHMFHSAHLSPDAELQHQQTHSRSMGQLDKSSAAAAARAHYLQHAPSFLSAGSSRRSSHASSTTSSGSHVTGSPSPLEGQPLSPFASTSSGFRFSAGPSDQPPPFHLSPPGAMTAGRLATMEVDTAPPDVDRLCSVCGDKAICMHYGARTCEGCKGFFKRTVQKKALYVCAGNKNCPIDKRYRSRCQYCRHQKCLRVGMVADVVRCGSLTGRRGRLPSKTKSSQPSSSSASSGGGGASAAASSSGSAVGGEPPTVAPPPPPPPSPPASIIALMTRAYTDTYVAAAPSAAPLFPFAAVVKSEYGDHRLHGAMSAVDVPTDVGGTEHWEDMEQDYLRVLTDEYHQMQLWAAKLPAVQDLAPADRDALIRTNFFQVLALSMAHRSIDCTSPADLQLASGGRLRGGDACPPTWRVWHDGVRQLVDSMRASRGGGAETDVTAVACLLALMLVDCQPAIFADRAPPLESIQSMTLNALKDHCATSPTLRLAQLVDTRRPLNRLALVALRALDDTCADVRRRRQACHRLSDTGAASYRLADDVALMTTVLDCARQQRTMRLMQSSAPAPVTTAAERPAVLDLVRPVGATSSPSNVITCHP